MSQHVTIEERLSALFDGELGSFEARRLTDTLLSDSAHQSRWLSYQVMRDVMRGEFAAGADNNFADRVMERIADEPELDVQTQHSQPRPWMKPAAGFALAASVAAVSIFALQFATRTGTTPAVDMATAVTPEQPVVMPQAQTLAEIPQAPVSDNGGMVRQVNTTDQVPAVLLGEVPLTDPRLDSYLATHAEFASRPGFLSRVRIVGYSHAPDQEEP